MGRVLAIDYGTRKSGIALSDEFNILATRLKIVPTKYLASNLSKIVLEKNITKIIIGLPDSKEDKNPMLEKIKKFCSEIEKEFMNIEIIKWNETMSSVQAHKNFYKKGKKNMIVDSEAARIILQEYLDFINETLNDRHKN
ncbi:MAG: Holliday junction resolvase RuvX [Candidatus Dojkabacteria bacterium]